MHRLLLALALLALPLFAFPANADDVEPVKPINLDKINTEADEDDPHLSFNGLSFFYSSKTKTGFRVYVAQRRTATAPWPAGKQFVDMAFKEADARSAFLTPEGRYPQHLYFATNKDLEKKNGKGSNYDIYYLIKQHAQADFTTLTPVQMVDTEEDELHPWLTADGMRIFFSRKTAEGWRIGLSSKPTGGGQWGEPKLLNFPVGFHHPTLTPDGRTMYLQGPLDEKRSGLFRSTLKGTSWSKPEALSMLNSSEGERGDISPCLSRNGAKLYFASDRPGGKGGLDLYVVDVALLVKK
jgi:hypothetical protein